MKTTVEKSSRLLAQVAAEVEGRDLGREELERYSKIAERELEASKGLEADALTQAWADLAECFATALRAGNAGIVLQ